MSGINWKNKTSLATVFGKKGHIMFGIDEVANGYVIRIIGMTNTVDFYREENPCKTIKEAKSFCQRKLREYIKKTEALLAELKK